MKKNKKLEERRKKISKDIKIFMDKSFDIRDFKFKIKYMITIENLLNMGFDNEYVNHNSFPYYRGNILRYETDGISCAYFLSDGVGKDKFWLYNMNNRIESLTIDLQSEEHLKEIWKALTGNGLGGAAVNFKMRI